MSKKTVLLVIEVYEADADAILFNDLHGNSQGIHDSGDTYAILSAETLEEHLESEEAQ